MGHLGLTPQSVHQLGGFRAQGKLAPAAKQLLDEAHRLQDAGCFSLVLESIPAELAEYVSKELEIPTIGIGAGAGCDGQVLVSHDMLGLFERFTPRFVKTYARLYDRFTQAFGEYIREVEERAFPAEKHSISMDTDEWDAFLSCAQEQKRLKQR
jgi:3-methyl-2-oxobutanoate hydroxymethyltransferase